MKSLINSVLNLFEEKTEFVSKKEEKGAAFAQVLEEKTQDLREKEFKIREVEKQKEAEKTPEKLVQKEVEKTLEKEVEKEVEKTPEKEIKAENIDAKNEDRKSAKSTVENAEIKNENTKVKEVKANIKSEESSEKDLVEAKQIIGLEMVEIITVIDILHLDKAKLDLSKIMKDFTSQVKELFSKGDNLEKIAQSKDIKELYALGKELGIKNIKITTISYSQSVALHKEFKGLPKDFFKDIIKPSFLNAHNSNDLAKTTSKILAELFQKPLDLFLRKEITQSKLESTGKDILKEVIKNLKTNEEIVVKKEVKSKAKAEVKAEIKADIKPEIKAEIKLDEKLEIKPDKKLIKVDLKNDTKPDLSERSILNNFIKKELEISNSIVEKPVSKIDNSIKEVLASLNNEKPLKLNEEGKVVLSSKVELKPELRETKKDSKDEKISAKGELKIEAKIDSKAEAFLVKTDSKIEADAKPNLSTLLTKDLKDLKDLKSEQELKVGEKEAPKLEVSIKDMALAKAEKSDAAATNEKIKTQFMQRFAQDFKESVEKFKSPITRLSFALNPKEFGEVNLTMIARANNLFINVSTQSAQALSMFIQNQEALRASIANAGFEGFSMSFGKEGSENASSQAQNQQQHSQNQAQKEEILEKIRERLDDEMKELEAAKELQKLQEGSANSLQIMLPNRIYA